jgi:hypothetical protein
LLPRPFKRIATKRLKPSDLGVYMTVCIVVACDEQAADTVPKLIMVSDTLLTLGATSARVLKARGIAPMWNTLVAGDDVTYTEDVIELARELVSLKQDHTLADIASSMTKAYQTIRRQQIEAQYLSSYDLTISEFLSKTPDFPTPTKRQSILDEIDKFDLGCEFLVCGFPSKDRKASKSPHIFQITNPGRYVPQTLLGYYAIGSGDISAVTYLARRNQHSFCSFEESLFNAIAAKKLAEKAQGVNEVTLVLVAEAGNPKTKWLTPAQIKGIVKIWDEEESKVRPNDFKERIKKIANPAELNTVPPESKTLGTEVPTPSASQKSAQAQ